MQARHLALADTFVFRGFEPETVGTILAGATERTVRNRYWVFEEGDEATELLFVLTGEVEVRKRISGGGEGLLAVLRAPAVIGEIGFLTKGARNAGAMARGDVDLLSLDWPSFEKVMESHPQAGMRFLLNLSRVLATRLDGADRALCP